MVYFIKIIIYSWTYIRQTKYIVQYVHVMITKGWSTKVSYFMTTWAKVNCAKASAW